MEITYQGKKYPIELQQSVLECLLSYGVAIPNSCRSGVCCSCIMKSDTPDLPSVAQNGLKESMKNQGYFLSCVCKPESDLVISDPDSSLQTQGVVQQLDLLSDEVLRVRFSVPEAFHYRAGQYISLVREDGLTRSYSIASLPESGYLELHIRLIPNGKMSSWFKNSVQVGDRVSIRGPSGHCYYSSQDKTQPLVLAGTGTGLAPLYGILKDALKMGHLGPIWLFHGGRNPFALYLREELEQLESQNLLFQYRPCVLEGGSEKIPQGNLDQVLLKTVPSAHLKNARVFLCGDPGLVNLLRKKVFLGGASSKEIYADAFLPNLS